MNKSEALGSEKIWPLLGRLCAPTIVAQLVNLLYSIVDKIYIGHIADIGTVALTGVGVTSSVILMIAAFAQFVGGGGAPLAAIALGKGDKDEAGRILGNGVTLLLVMSAGLMAVLYAAKRPLLTFVGASAQTLPYADDYLSIYMLGTVMVQLTIGLTPFLSAQGNARMAMVAVIAGAGINLCLDPLFIFTFGMGVKGAAIATVLAQTASAAVVVGYLAGKKAEVRIRLSLMKLHRRVVGKILSLGVSPFVMAATESVITIVMNSGLRNYGGDEYVGCLTIMSSVMQFIGVPLTGFTQGAAPVISYNFGAGNTARVKEAFRDCFIVMVSYTTLFAASTMVFPGLYARIFTGDPVLIALTEKALPVFMAGMLVFGVQRACQTTFMALGQAKISLFIAILRKILLLVPLALLLPKAFGVWGIYWAEPIADTLAATTCGLLFWHFFPKMLARGADR